MIYNQWKNYKFNFSFDGCENITSTYSQSFQDIFILTMLNGKQRGTFLEIGANVPMYANNTYLLSSNFKWTGLSIDIVDFNDQWKNLRPNDNFLCADALSVNYEQLLDSFYITPVIDYLQLDIDPSIYTLEALKKIPLNKYKFKIITFETDIYFKGSSESVRDESRKILIDNGYRLLIEDVNVWWQEQYLPYEDWYIHPDYVDSELADNIQKMSKLTNSIPEKFLFKNL